MSTPSLQAHLEAQHRALPPAFAAQAWRRDALASFAARGFPTRHEERWHYTDLRPLESGRFALVPRVPTAETRAAARQLLEERGIDLPGPRLVFVDGHFDAALSRLGVAPGVGAPKAIGRGAATTGAG